MHVTSKPSPANSDSRTRQPPFRAPYAQPINTTALCCGRATQPALLAPRPASIGSCPIGHSWLPRLEASNFATFFSPWLRSFPSSIVVCPVLRRISSQKVKFSSLTARCFCSTLSGRYLSRQVHLHILTYLSCNHRIPPSQLFQDLLPTFYSCPVRVADSLRKN